MAALLSGLAPALHASKADVVSALKDDAQAPLDRPRLRNAFVVAQVAFSILLVVVAAILVRAFDGVSSIDRGFDPSECRRRIGESCRWPATPTHPGRHSSASSIERVRALPGVEVATVADRVPGPGSMSFGGLTVPGVQQPPGSNPSSTRTGRSWTRGTSRRCGFRSSRAGTSPPTTAQAVSPSPSSARAWRGASGLARAPSVSTSFVHTGNLNVPNPPGARVAGRRRRRRPRVRRIA